MRGDISTAVLAACLKKRGGSFFSLKQISDDTGLEMKAVRRELQRLVVEGHVVRYQAQMGTPHPHGGAYPVVNILYGALPSLKHRKEVKDNRRRKDTAWDRMWRAVRVMRRFTKKDLIITAGAGRENADYFLKHLRRAGFLHQTGGGKAAVWRLAGNVSPQRPSWAEIKRLQKERRQ